MAESVVEERDVPAVHQAKLTRLRLRWGRADQERYWIAVDSPGGTIEETGRDLFDALTSVRRRLEADGWLLVVQGARRDSYPSGMLRDMVGARKVYLLQPGEPPSRMRLADIFADADPRDAATVDEQYEHYLAWTRSRG